METDRQKKMHRERKEKFTEALNFRETGEQETDQQRGGVLAVVPRHKLNSSETHTKHARTHVRTHVHDAYTHTYIRVCIRACARTGKGGEADQGLR